MIIIKAGKYVEYLLRWSVDHGLFISRGEALCCAMTASKIHKGRRTPSLKGLEQTIQARQARLKAKGLKQ